MTEKPEISITQLSYGMTPEELISEGYVDTDYFYDPASEEWKIEVEKMEQIVKENQIPDSECIPF
ncbi:MAG: hypothetical protein ACHBN1_00840 [Heteroscytonema crispum UTEX LB 1556]